MMNKSQKKMWKNQHQQRRLKQWEKPDLTELDVKATRGGRTLKHNENIRHHNRPSG